MWLLLSSYAVVFLIASYFTLYMHKGYIRAKATMAKRIWRQQQAQVSTRKSKRIAAKQKNNDASDLFLPPGYY